jgi:GntR family transcriptional regulator/MocR family aminotransferase
MTDFMVDGHFERHIRRMRTIYQERQEILVQAARRELSAYLRVEPADAGMTIIGWLTNLHDMPVARAAARADIDVLALSPYCIERSIPPAVLLGYSGVREKDIHEGVTRLAAVLRELASDRRAGQVVPAVA